MRTFTMLIVLSIILSSMLGCAMNDTSRGDMSARQTDASVYARTATEPAASMQSLFKEDQSIISDAELQAALAAKVTLPEDAKLTVVRVGSMPYWWGWSEEFVRMNQKIDDDFLGELAKSKRLNRVAYLPTLVTPTKITIPYLRQAAARLQSHLVLVYFTATRNYDKQRVFGPDETKAYCTVEAVLLDTRSGTIPFSTVVTEGFHAKRVSSDIDFNETIAKANQEAIGRAWLKMAGQVRGYLDSIK